MATSSAPAVAVASLLILCSTAARSHEAASPSQCQVAASRPPIADARARVSHDPADLRASFALADAWSDAGCFSDAVGVLQSATALHPQNAELETRLRVAKSLVGEEHFFEDLDRADMQAKLKRATFRCSTLSDLDACTEALHMKPDDPLLLSAQGDALMHAKRAGDAVTRYRRAAALEPDFPDIGQKIVAAEAELPAASGAAAKIPAVRIAGALPAFGRRYSNVAPGAQTH